MIRLFLRTRPASPLKRAALSSVAQPSAKASAASDDGVMKAPRVRAENTAQTRRQLALRAPGSAQSHGTMGGNLRVAIGNAHGLSHEATAAVPELPHDLADA